MSTTRTTFDLVRSIEEIQDEIDFFDWYLGYIPSYLINELAEYEEALRRSNPKSVSAPNQVSLIQSLTY